MNLWLKFILSNFQASFFRFHQDKRLKKFEFKATRKTENSSVQAFRAILIQRLPLSVKIITLDVVAANQRGR